MNVLDLPEEVLAYLLQWMKTETLESLMLSCKTFLRVVRSTRYELDFTPLVRTSTARQIAISKRFWCLQNLYLQNVHTDLTDELILDLCNSCANLSVLHIVSQNKDSRLITSAGIMSIARCLNYLKDLKFGFLPKVKNDALAVMGDNCHALTALSVESCDELNAEGFMSLMNGKAGVGKRLQSFRLACMMLLDDRSLAPVLRAAPALTTLKLNNIDANEACMQAVADGCKKLSTLDLDWCSVNFIAIGHLERCTTLEDVTIVRCRKVANLKALVAGSHKTLQRLALVQTEDVLQAVLAGCRELRELDVFGASQVEDKHLEAAVRACPKLRKIYSVGTAAVRPQYDWPAYCEAVHRKYH